MARFSDGKQLSELCEPERARIIGYMLQGFAPAWDYTLQDVPEIDAGRGCRAGNGREHH